MDCDVVKSAETILQVLEVALKFRSMLRSGGAFEQGFEKFSGVTQLLQRDPQFMTLTRIKLLQLLSLLHHLGGPLSQYILCKPLDRPTAGGARVFCPIANLYPFKCFENKRLITRGLDCLCCIRKSG